MAKHASPRTGTLSREAWRHRKTLPGAVGPPAFSLPAPRHGAAQAMRGARSDARPIGDRLERADQTTTNVQCHADAVADAAASVDRTRVSALGGAVRAVERHERLNGAGPELRRTVGDG